MRGSTRASHIDGFVARAKPPDPDGSAFVLSQARMACGERRSSCAHASLHFRICHGAGSAPVKVTSVSAPKLLPCD